MTEQVQKQGKAADGRRPVEEQLSRKSVELKPSGIRRFFDIVSEMKDAISLGVGEPDFDTPWHSDHGRRVRGD